MALPKEIRPLTGLRGVAALYVMGFHYSIGLGFSSHFATLMSHGYLAVDLFFCLSGFVMALSYGDMFAGNWSSATYFRFIGRRIARVYPLYLVVTVAAFALVVIGWPGTTASSGLSLALAFALNLAMVQVWGFTDSFDGAAWSLSAEWAAYLIFPLLLVPALRRRSSIAWLTGILCVSIIVLLPALRTSIGERPSPHALLDIFQPTMGLPVLRCLSEFTLGLIAYRMACTPVGCKLAQSKWAAPIVLLATVAMMTIADIDAAIVMMFIACLVVLSSEKSGPGKWLSSYPFQLAGQLSYSIYLTHLLFNGLVARVHERIHAMGLPHAQTYAAMVGFVLTLSVSFLLYFYVEVPCRRLLRRTFERRANRHAMSHRHTASAAAAAPAHAHADDVNATPPRGTRVRALLIDKLLLRPTGVHRDHEQPQHR